MVPTPAGFTHHTENKSEFDVSEVNKTSTGTTGDNKQGRGLDFVVFGFARSGTTAVTDYLNAVEGIHCGKELFRNYMDHTAIFAPESFLNDRLPQPANGPNKSRRLNPAALEFSRNAIAAQGNSIRYFGNKMPNYFYRLQGIIDEIATNRALLVVRNITDVAKSYHVRAHDPDDPWDPGRDGMTALGDAYVLLHALNRLQGANVMVVPHRALVADWEATIRTAAQHIAPDMEIRFRPDQIRDIQSGWKEKKSRPKGELDAATQAEIKEYQATGIDDLLIRDAPYNLSELRPKLAQYITALPADPIAYLKSKISVAGQPEQMEFIDIWSKRINKSRGNTNAQH